MTTLLEKPTLLDAMPGGIETSEKRGQAKLVASTKLPVDGLENPVFKKMGIKFGPPDEDDPLFCEAELPAGWKLVPARDSSYWSYVTDETETIRASVFYKAAFYDRKARISPEKRIKIEVDYETCSAHVVVGTRIIRKFTHTDAYEVYGLAVKWLNEAYPLWNGDDSDYWDNPDQIKEYAED